MNNDERILRLKKSIEEKRAEIEKIGKYVPVTTCIIQPKFGEKINLHVLDENELVLLLSWLQAMIIGLSDYVEYGNLDDIDLEIDEPKISGFAIAEWKEDIKNLLRQKKIKSKKLQLNAMEKKLTALLSEDKRTELELDDIEALLK